MELAEQSTPRRAASGICLEYKAQNDRSCHLSFLHESYCQESLIYLATYSRPLLQQDHNSSRATPEDYTLPLQLLEPNKSTYRYLSLLTPSNAAPAFRSQPQTQCLPTTPTPSQRHLPMQLAQLPTRPPLNPSTPTLPLRRGQIVAMVANRLR